ncbi:DNA cytosine methyltransferase [Desulfovirgula thermocuniculi]|uniref:DNA cytosine methyltransferase n=1 Tax=Desulfovirgula thermocuniculi TaxID=348842 RepID=UPI0003F97DB3|nr:DNA cytosine methyltransferase [Desulfovirgula thermocuniculi]
MEVVYRLGELFCGPGGLALGASRAVVRSPAGVVYRCTHVWANDIDPWACETFRHNLCRDGSCLVINAPVEKLELEKLPEIDGLLFGFPCNDYSLVGEHRGLDGEYGPLYSYGVKALKIHRPLWFVAENVEGLASANDGLALQSILRELAEAGYRITPHLYKFEEYGVPQIRHRIIIVGFRRDLGLVFRVPKPTHVGRYVTAAEALRGVEQVPHNNERTRHKQRVVEMLMHIPPGGNAWHPDVPEHLRLNVRGCRLSNIYRRLRPDEPSPTITGCGGGGTHGYHWAEPRALTNRERARLQTFPDDFVFIGPKEAVRAQIGGAVPPLAAEVIVTAVLKTLAGVEYEWVQPNIEVACQIRLEELLPGTAAGALTA